MPGDDLGIPDRCKRALRRTLPYRTVRMFVSATVVYAIVGSFVYLLAVENSNPPAILWMTVIAFGLAAAYVIFGKANVDNAVDATQELAGRGDSDDDSEEDDGGQP